MEQTTLSQILSWVILALLSGSLVGIVLTRQRGGLGRWRNFGVGLIGALIGALIVGLFRLDLGVFSVTITFTGLLFSIVGALIFVLGLHLLRRRRTGP